MTLNILRPLIFMFLWFLAGVFVGFWWSALPIDGRVLLLFGCFLFLRVGLDWAGGGKK